MNYEHDQERLLNVSSQAVQAAVSVGTALWQMKANPVKISIKTAKDDVQIARQEMEKGRDKAEIAETLRQETPYQRLVASGNDGDKYVDLVMQRAEIDRAVQSVPIQQEKTLKKAPKKSLS